ncbi:MAG: DUF2877 domain-containing protein [Elusimicrobia bacterium]|nr:DUF2877 domain-containing protein [Elusimicrobiota bacterium]
MDLISYGDSIPEGDYRLHSAFEHAINFRKGRIIVSLVPPRAGSGPMNVVLKHMPAGAKRFRASRFYFYIDENRLRKAPEALYDSAVPVLEAEPEIVSANLAELVYVLAAAAPEKSLCFIFTPKREKDFKRVFEKHLLARMKKAVAFFRAGKYARGTKTMRGLGFGLTPSGDDFLSGLLAGFNYALCSLRFNMKARIEEIYRHAEGDNIISNAFLRASYEGKVNAKILRLMRALSGADKEELKAAATEALETGHTSGADFCAGLIFALQDALGNSK